MADVTNHEAVRHLVAWGLVGMGLRHKWKDRTVVIQPSDGGRMSIEFDARNRLTGIKAETPMGDGSGIRPLGRKLLPPPEWMEFPEDPPPPERKAPVSRRKKRWRR